MKAKMIIERVIKVINIMINLGIGFVCTISAFAYGTNAYMYSDTLNRIPWLLWMFVIINILDHLIRKMIREF